MKKGTKCPRYTEKEWAEMLEMFKQGATYKEIAEMTGRTAAGVARKFQIEGYGVTKKDGPKTIEIEGKKLVKQKTLNDFTIREIVKNLYDRGCRIKNNKLYIIQEREVKLSDII